MADKDEKKGAPEGTAAPVRSKKKLIIFIVAGVVAVAVIGGGLFLFLNSKKSAAPKDNAAVSEAPKAEEKKSEGGHGGGGGEKVKPGNQLLFTLEPFILNLADVDTNRYLKISIVLEFADAKSATDAESRVPQVRDALVLLMSSLTYGDIHSVEGKLTLQSEILNRLNKILTPGSVKRVYFTDLVVQ